VSSPLAEALRALGSEHALVVHSDDGLDELSIAAPTQVSELKDGEVHDWRLDPADYGCAHADLDGLAVDSAQASAALIRGALDGEPGDSAVKARAIIALNAGATLYAAGVAAGLKEGVALAEDLIATGQAMEKLNAFVNFTQLMRESGQ
jgi:anthranilate phosphoribosyltransferase